MAPEPRNAGITMARKNRLALNLIVGAVLLSTCMGVVSTIAGVLTLVPTDAARVADLYPPVEDRSGRRLDPDRCGLIEVRTPDGCAPARPQSVQELEVTFPSRLPHKGIQELRGTLSVPQGLDGPRPAVVIVHGSGPNLRDGAVPGDLIARFKPPFEVYRSLAELLSQHGLVVLRYDKRTSRPYRDAIDPTQFAFWDFVEDARDGLDFLASRPEVDGQALIVVGHSQGGQLAPHIVQGDERVAAVLLLGGSTQTLGHLMIEQLERFGEIRKMQYDYLTPWLLRFNLAPIRACFEPIWDGTYDPEQICMSGVTQRALADYEAFAAGAADGGRPALRHPGHGGHQHRPGRDPAHARPAHRARRRVPPRPGPGPQPHGSARAERPRPLRRGGRGPDPHLPALGPLGIGYAGGTRRGLP